MNEKKTTILVLCIHQFKQLFFAAHVNGENKQMKWYRTKLLLVLDQLEVFYQHSDSID